jgi:hypothetical protein
MFLYTQTELEIMWVTAPALEDLGPFLGRNWRCSTIEEGSFSSHEISIT